jgi:hypothetical protein
MLYFIPSKLKGQNMDGMMYPISLVIVAVLAFTFNRNNNSFLMMVTLAVGAYIIFSHETGHTATELKNDVIKTIDENTVDYNKGHNTKEFEQNK